MAQLAQLAPIATLARLRGRFARPVPSGGAWASRRQRSAISAQASVTKLLTTYYLPNYLPLTTHYLAGHYCAGGSASSCAKSTYNPLAGQSLQTACEPCPTNSLTPGTAATSATDCACIVRYYNHRLANETVECVSCPVGSNCVDEGTTLALLPLTIGYYRTGNNSDDLRRCPDFGDDSGCTGGTGFGEGPCKPGLEVCSLGTRHTVSYTASSFHAQQPAGGFAHTHTLFYTHTNKPVRRGRTVRSARSATARTTTARVSRRACSAKVICSHRSCSWRESSQPRSG